MKLIVLAALAMAPAVIPAAASSSDWFEMEGASIRLVTAGAPDTQGRVKAVLDVELKPGWKTYWRDPGDAGVPPVLDVSANPNIAKAELDFPAPQRHDEGDFRWAGYDRPVQLPLTLTLKDAAGPSAVEADVFLGVCETICVPVQAKLAVDPQRDPDNADDAAAVTAAFSAIPAPAKAGFEAKVVEKGADKAVIEATFPGAGDSADLFLAGEEGYAFTTPEREVRDGKTYFTVEVTRPDATPAGPGLHYTLVTEAGAVNGLLPYF